MPRHNTHHAETCRRISLAHLENCSYCSYLLMSIMSHRKTFTWLVLSHRITFFGWLVAAMFCWQPSHQSKQHPIYPNRSIQNTSDTNSACCCAGWSWKLRKDFKAKWNREIMVISNRNIIFQIPFWGSRIDLGDVNVRQLDPFKRLGWPLYSLPGSLSGDSSRCASEPSRLLKLWPYHLPSTWGGRTVLSCYPWSPKMRWFIHFSSYNSRLLADNPLSHGLRSWNMAMEKPRAFKWDNRT